MILINFFLLILLRNSIAYDISDIIRSWTHGPKRLRNGDDFLSIMKNLNGPRSTTLDLGWDHLQNKGTVVFSNYIKHSKITKVDLSGNRIGYPGASALASVLHKTKIVALSLRCNKLGYKGVIPIAQVLKDTPITELNLETTAMGVEGAMGLAKGLIGTRITTLDLANNQILDRGVQAIADSLNKTVIQKLNLRNNGFGVQGATALASVLNGTKIVSLSLGWNKLGYKGVLPIAHVLKDTSIRELNLGNNKLKDIGTFVVADGLIGTRIRSLDLSRNEIGLDGVEAIANVLKNTPVTYLNLRGNHINSEGVRILISVLSDTQITNLEGFSLNREVRVLCKRNRDRIVRLYKDFKDFVVKENGVLEFDVEKFYAKKKEYIDFARIVGKKKGVYRVLFGTERQDFVDNIETRLSNCVGNVERSDRQCKELVRDGNGKLGFNVDKAFGNVFEYIKFAEFVERRKVFVCEDFEKREVRDFVKNVGRRLSECFREANWIYQRFENFVVDGRRGLEFKVDGAHANRSEYVEFAGILGKRREIFLRRFLTEGRLNYSGDKIRDFVGDVERRLRECLRRTDLVYRAFKSFVLREKDGPSLKDDFDAIVSNRLGFINYLISKGDGFYPREKVEGFVNNL